MAAISLYRPYDRLTILIEVPFEVPMTHFISDEEIRGTLKNFSVSFYKDNVPVRPFCGPCALCQYVDEFARYGDYRKFFLNLNRASSDKSLIAQANIHSVVETYVQVNFPDHSLGVNHV